MEKKKIIYEKLKRNYWDKEMCKVEVERWYKENHNFGIISEDVCIIKSNFTKTLNGIVDVK